MYFLGRADRRIGTHPAFTWLKDRWHRESTWPPLQADVNYTLPSVRLALEHEQVSTC